MEFNVMDRKVVYDPRKSYVTPIISKSGMVKPGAFDMQVLDTYVNPCVDGFEQMSMNEEILAVDPLDEDSLNGLDISTRYVWRELSGAILALNRCYVAYHAEDSKIKVGRAGSLKMFREGLRNSINLLEMTVGGNVVEWDE
jgi:hypothetical protein